VPWSAGPPLAPEILLAFLKPQKILAFSSFVRRLNRSGSCWGIEQFEGSASRPSRSQAIQRSGQVEAPLKEALHGSFGSGPVDGFRRH